MPTFIEQMTTENQTEISNLSMFIMKSFEIRFFLYILIKYAPCAFFLVYI